MNDLAAATETVPMSAHLLLVEPDADLADRLTQQLADALPGVLTTHCESLAAARAYLAGTAFDAVCTADDLPDGSGLDLLTLRDELGLAAPVMVRTQLNGVFRTEAKQAGAAACFSFDGQSTEAVEMLTRVLGRPSSAVAGTESPRALADSDAAALLEALRAETGVVAHAINNPMTVITGNVQFLREVAQTSDVDPLLTGPIDDIGAAAEQLSEALNQLAALRQRIAAALGTSDRL